MDLYTGLILFTTVIDYLNSLASREGEKKIQDYANKLSSLRKQIDERNAIRQQDIDALQNTLHTLQNMRYQIDPRLIQKVDNTIAKVSRKVSDINFDIAADESNYNQQAIKQPQTSIAANSGQIDFNAINKGINSNHLESKAGLLT